MSRHFTPKHKPTLQSHVKRLETMLADYDNGKISNICYICPWGSEIVWHKYCDICRKFVYLPTDSTGCPCWELGEIEAIMRTIESLDSYRVAQYTEDKLHV